MRWPEGFFVGRQDLIDSLSPIQTRARQVHRLADNTPTREKRQVVLAAAEAFRVRYENALKSPSGYIQSVSLEIPNLTGSNNNDGKGPSDSINISRGAEKADTTLTHSVDGEAVMSLQLNKASIAQGLILVEDAMKSVGNVNSLQARATDWVNKKLLEAFTFFMAGYNHDTQSGNVLNISRNSNKEVVSEIKVVLGGMFLLSVTLATGKTVTQGLGIINSTRSKMSDITEALKHIMKKKREGNVITDVSLNLSSTMGKKLLYFAKNDQNTFEALIGTTTTPIIDGVLQHGAVLNNGLRLTNKTVDIINDLAGEREVQADVTSVSFKEGNLVIGLDLYMGEDKKVLVASVEIVPPTSRTRSGHLQVTNWDPVRNTLIGLGRVARYGYESYLNFKAFQKAKDEVGRKFWWKEFYTAVGGEKDGPVGGFKWWVTHGPVRSATIYANPSNPLRIENGLTGVQTWLTHNENGRPQFSLLLKEGTSAWAAYSEVLGSKADLINKFKTNVKNAQLQLDSWVGNNQYILGYDLAPEQQNLPGFGMRDQIPQRPTVDRADYSVRYTGATLHTYTDQENLSRTRYRGGDCWDGFCDPVEVIPPSRSFVWELIFPRASVGPLANLSAEGLNAYKDRYDGLDPSSEGRLIAPMAALPTADFYKVTAGNIDYNSKTVNDRIGNVNVQITYTKYPVHDQRTLARNSLVDISITNMDAYRSALNRLDDRIEDFDKKYLNQKNHGVPVGRIGTEGRFTTGNRGGVPTFSLNVSIVDHNSRAKIGDYMYGQRLDESGNMIFDDFVSYDLTAAPVKAAMKAGLAGDLVNYEASRHGMPTAEINGIPAAKIDTTRAIFLSGIMGGEVVSRAVREIVNPLTYEKIGDHVDGVSAGGKAENYASYNRSSAYVQSLIAKGILKNPVVTPSRGQNTPTTAPPQRIEFGLKGPPFPPAKPGQNASEAERAEYDAAVVAFVDHYKFPPELVRPSRSDYRCYYLRGDAKKELEYVPAGAVDEFAGNNDFVSATNTNLNTEYTKALGSYNTAVTAHAKFINDFGWDPLIKDSEKGTAYKTNESEYRAALTAWQNQYKLTPAEYDKLKRKNELIDEFNAFLTNLTDSGTNARHKGFEIKNEGVLIIGRSGGVAIHESVVNVSWDGVKAATLSYGTRDGYSTCVISYDVRNARGQISKHKEIGVRINAVSIDYWDISRVNTAWDGAGRATAYTETKDTRSPDGTEGNGVSRTAMSNIHYDEDGRIFSYSESYTEGNYDPVTRRDVFGAPVTIVVSDIQYDNGLETSRTFSASWGTTHYGRVPGVADGINGWQNARVDNLITRTTYDGETQQVNGRITRGTLVPLANTINDGILKGSGEEGKDGQKIENEEKLKESFEFFEKQSYFTYDGYGRTTSYRTETNTLERVMVVDYETKGWGPTRHEVAVTKYYARMMTRRSTVRLSDFDKFGRAQRIATNYSAGRPGGGASTESGSSIDSNIVYNANGDVVSKNSISSSYVNAGVLAFQNITVATVTNTYNKYGQLESSHQDVSYSRSETHTLEAPSSNAFGTVFTIAVMVAVAVIAPQLAGPIVNAMGFVAGTAAANAAIVIVSAVIVGVAKFALTLAMGGDLKTALINGLISGVTAYFQFSDAMQAAQADMVAQGVVAPGEVATVTGEQLSTATLNQMVGPALAKSVTSFGAKVLVAVLKEVVKYGVAQAIQSINPDLGFLGGMIVDLAFGGIANFDPSKFLKNFVKSVATVAASKILTRVLGKNAFLAPLLLSMLGFMSGGAGNNVLFDLFDFFKTDGVAPFNPIRNIVWGALSSLGEYAIAKVFENPKYSSQMFIQKAGTTIIENGKVLQSPGSEMTVVGYMFSSGVRDLVSSAGKFFNLDNHVMTPQMAKDTAAKLLSQGSIRTSGGEEFSAADPDTFAKWLETSRGGQTVVVTRLSEDGAVQQPYELSVSGSAVNFKPQGNEVLQGTQQLLPGMNVIPLFRDALGGNLPDNQEPVLVQMPDGNMGTLVREVTPAGTTLSRAEQPSMRQVDTPQVASLPSMPSQPEVQDPPATTFFGSIVDVVFDSGFGGLGDLFALPAKLSAPAMPEVVTPVTHLGSTDPGFEGLTLSPSQPPAVSSPDTPRYTYSLVGKNETGPVINPGLSFVVEGGRVVTPDLTQDDVVSFVRMGGVIVSMAESKIYEKGTGSGENYTPKQWLTILGGATVTNDSVVMPKMEWGDLSNGAKTLLGNFGIKTENFGGSETRPVFDRRTGVTSLGFSIKMSPQVVSESLDVQYGDRSIEVKKSVSGVLNLNSQDNVTVHAQLTLSGEGSFAFAVSNPNAFSPGTRAVVAAALGGEIHLADMKSPVIVQTVVQTPEKGNVTAKTYVVDLRVKDPEGFVTYLKSTNSDLGKLEARSADVSQIKEPVDIAVTLQVTDGQFNVVEARLVKPSVETNKTEMPKQTVTAPAAKVEAPKTIKQPPAVDVPTLRTAITKSDVLTKNDKVFLLSLPTETLVSILPADLPAMPQPLSTVTVAGFKVNGSGKIELVVNADTSLPAPVDIRVVESEAGTAPKMLRDVPLFVGLGDVISSYEKGTGSGENYTPKQMLSLLGGATVTNHVIVMPKMEWGDLSGGAKSLLGNFDINEDNFSSSETRPVFDKRSGVTSLGFSKETTPLEVAKSIDTQYGDRSEVKESISSVLDLDSDKKVTMHAQLTLGGEGSIAIEVTDSNTFSPETREVVAAAQGGEMKLGEMKKPVIVHTEVRKTELGDVVAETLIVDLKVEDKKEFVTYLKSKGADLGPLETTVAKVSDKKETGDVAVTLRVTEGRVEIVEKVKPVRKPEVDTEKMKLPEGQKFTGQPVEPGAIQVRAEGQKQELPVDVLALRTAITESKVLTQDDKVILLSLSDKQLGTLLANIISVDGIVPGSVERVQAVVGQEAVVGMDVEVSALTGRAADMVKASGIEQKDGKVRLEIGLDSGRLFVIFAVKGDVAHIQGVMQAAGVSVEIQETAIKNLKSTMSEDSLKNGKYVFVARISPATDTEAAVGFLVAKVAVSDLTAEGQAIAKQWQAETVEVKIDVATGLVTIGIEKSGKELNQLITTFAQEKGITNPVQAMKQFFVAGGVGEKAAERLTQVLNGNADSVERITFETTVDGKTSFVRVEFKLADGEAGKRLSQFASGPMKGILKELRQGTTVDVTFNQDGKLVGDIGVTLSKDQLKDLAGQKKILEGLPLEVLEKLKAAGADFEMQFIFKGGKAGPAHTRVILKFDESTASKVQAVLGLTGQSLPVSDGQVGVMFDGRGWSPVSLRKETAVQSLLKEVSTIAKQSLKVDLVVKEGLAQILDLDVTLGMKIGDVGEVEYFKVSGGKPIALNGALVQNGKTLAEGEGSLRVTEVGRRKDGTLFIASFEVTASAEGVLIGNQFFTNSVVEVRGTVVASVKGGAAWAVLQDQSGTRIYVRVEEKEGQAPTLQTMKRDSNGVLRRQTGGDALVGVSLRVGDQRAIVTAATLMQSGKSTQVELTVAPMDLKDGRTLTTVLMDAQFSLVGLAGRVTGTEGVSLLQGGVKVHAQQNAEWSTTATGALSFAAGTRVTVVRGAYNNVVGPNGQQFSGTEKEVVGAFNDKGQIEWGGDLALSLASGQGNQRTHLVLMKETVMTKWEEGAHFPSTETFAGSSSLTADGFVHKGFARLDDQVLPVGQAGSGGTTPSQASFNKYSVSDGRVTGVIFMDGQLHSNAGEITFKNAGDALHGYTAKEAGTKITIGLDGKVNLVSGTYRQETPSSRIEVARGIDGKVSEKVVAIKDNGKWIDVKQISAAGGVFVVKQDNLFKDRYFVGNGKSWMETSAVERGGLTTLTGFSLSMGEKKTLTSITVGSSSAIQDIVSSVLTFGSSFLATSGTTAPQGRVVSMTIAVQTGAEFSAGGRAKADGTVRINFEDQKTPVIADFEVGFTKADQDAFLAKHKDYKGPLIDFADSKMKPNEEIVLIPVEGGGFVLKGDRKSLPMTFIQTVHDGNKIVEKRISGDLVNDKRARFVLTESGMDFQGLVDIGEQKMAIKVEKGGAGGKIDGRGINGTYYGKKNGHYIVSGTLLRQGGQWHFRGAGALLMIKAGATLDKVTAVTDTQVRYTKSGMDILNNSGHLRRFGAGAVIDIYKNKMTQTLTAEKQSITVDGSQATISTLSKGTVISYVRGEKGGWTFAGISGGTRTIEVRQYLSVEGQKGEPKVSLTKNGRLEVKGSSGYFSTFVSVDSKGNETVTRDYSGMKGRENHSFVGQDNVKRTVHSQGLGEVWGGEMRGQARTGDRFSVPNQTAEIKGYGKVDFKNGVGTVLEGGVKGKTLTIDRGVSASSWGGESRGAEKTHITVTDVIVKINADTGDLIQQVRGLVRENAVVVVKNGHGDGSAPNGGKAVGFTMMPPTKEGTTFIAGKNASADFVLPLTKGETTFKQDQVQALMFTEGSVHKAGGSYVFQGASVKNGESLTFGKNGQLSLVDGKPPVQPAASLLKEGARALLSEREWVNLANSMESTGKRETITTKDGLEGKITRREGTGLTLGASTFDLEVTVKSTGDKVTMAGVFALWNRKPGNGQGSFDLKSTMDAKYGEFRTLQPMRGGSFNAWGTGDATLKTNILGLPVTLTRNSGNWGFSPESLKTVLAERGDFVKGLESKMKGDVNSSMRVLSIEKIENFGIGVGADGNIAIDRVVFQGQSFISARGLGEEFTPRDAGHGGGSPVAGDVTLRRFGVGFEVTGKQTWEISGTPRIMLNHAGVRINVLDADTAQALRLDTHGVGQYVVNDKNGLNAVGWGAVSTKLLVSVGAVYHMAVWAGAVMVGEHDFAFEYHKSTVDPLVSIARGGTGVQSSLGYFSSEVTTSDRLAVAMDGILVLAAPLGAWGIGARAVSSFRVLSAVESLSVSSLAKTFAGEFVGGVASGFLSRTGAAYLSGMTFGTISYGLDSIATSFRSRDFKLADSDSFFVGFRTGAFFSFGIQGAGLAVKGIGSSISTTSFASVSKTAEKAWSTLSVGTQTAVKYSGQIVLGGAAMAGFSVLNAAMSGQTVGLKELGYLFVTGMVVTAAFLAMRGYSGLGTAGMSPSAMGTTLTKLAENPWIMPVLAAEGAISFALTGPAFSAIGYLMDAIPVFGDLRGFLLGHKQDMVIGPGFVGNLFEAIASSAEMGKMGLYFSSLGAVVHGALPQRAAAATSKGEAVKQSLSQRAGELAKVSNQKFLTGPGKTAAQLSVMETVGAGAGYLASEGLIKAGFGDLALSDEQRTNYAHQVAFAGLMAVHPFSRLAAEGRAVRYLSSTEQSGRFGEHMDLGYVVVPSRIGQVGEVLFGAPQPVRLTDGIVLRAGERITGLRYDRAAIWSEGKQPTETEVASAVRLNAVFQGAVAMRLYEDMGTRQTSNGTAENIALIEASMSRSAAGAEPTFRSANGMTYVVPRDGPLSTTFRVMRTGEVTREVAERGGHAAFGTLSAKSQEALRSSVGNDLTLNNATIVRGGNGGLRAEFKGVDAKNHSIHLLGDQASLIRENSFVMTVNLGATGNVIRESAMASGEGINNTRVVSQMRRLGIVDGATTPADRSVQVTISLHKDAKGRTVAARTVEISPDRLTQQYRAEIFGDKAPTNAVVRVDLDGRRGVIVTQKEIVGADGPAKVDGNNTKLAIETVDTLSQRYGLERSGPVVVRLDVSGERIQA
ncbi:MAG: hypothetical protein IPN19_02045 [Elusimicrobia bacterium]|nr:hypothetical protein [Elusimicrobiota bacterium]